MKALIDPRESRVCQVQADEFAVAEPLFWIDCDDDVTPETHEYVDGQFVLIAWDKLAQVESQRNQYPAARLDHVQTILATTYQGLELASVKRQNDNTVVGVEALRAFSVEGQAVGATMLSLRGWIADCQKMGVPAFAMLQAQSGITQQELIKFFTDQGFVNVDEVDGATYVALPWASLQTARRHRDIDAERDRKIEAGFAWGGKTWDADPISRANLTGVAAAVNAGLALPIGFVWRSKTNENVALDGAGVLSLAKAMLDHVNQCYVEAWAAKEQEAVH